MLEFQHDGFMHYADAMIKVGENAVLDTNAFAVEVGEGSDLARCAVEPKAIWAINEYMEHWFEGEKEKQKVGAGNVPIVKR
ncbi:hypothetical protein LJC33_00035 [Eubacteriales bacterium OttesenSCG-928-N13]|nr:hypothetical protein [Eubacteriales bacterium OttesenSCG-928-N13]